MGSILSPVIADLFMEHFEKDPLPIIGPNVGYATLMAHLLHGHIKRKST